MDVYYNRYKQAKAMSLMEYRKEHSKKWDRIIKYARANWDELVKNADSRNGGVSIAEQLQQKFNIPSFISNDIANTLNLFKHTIEGV